MKFLVSNDDGIQARGIAALARALLPYGEVTVVAPNRERSACSHSLTLEHPLRTAPVDFPVPVHRALSVNGTPADCVKLGLAKLMETPPDLVVAGINKGANTTVDVFYSGTVAAAFEGVFNDVPAIAFSLASFDHDADYSLAQTWVARTLDRILQDGPAKGFVYNVNIPYLPDSGIRGIRLTRLGNVRYRDSYELRHDPVGRPYYWLTGEPEILDQDPACDIVALREGFVSMTPIRAELTDASVLERWRRKQEWADLASPVRP
ncbi:MAG: 5'/3'-nucleotidase SurE [Candidatus Riflebacteria bacterium]|nr:5'/3'-nucleotidase SurE [Candidatus Riflebacteria bacterium]